jgi:signal transduction histidine kinase
MASIARTLTVSLSAAAIAIFMVVLTLVIGLDLIRDPAHEHCMAAAEIVSQATVIGPGQHVIVKSTDDLQHFQSSNPDLWYSVSYGDQFIEYGVTRRPVLPFGLPYVGPIGRSLIDTSDGTGALCLDVAQRGDKRLAILVSGFRIGFGQIAKSFIQRNFFILLSVACAFASVVAVGALLSSRFVVRSIDRVTRLALAIEPTSPRALIPLDLIPRELVSLISALNRAFEEIAAHMRRQRRFLGNASHELRTPLAILHAKMENISDPELRAELLRDIGELTHLVSAMLGLARLQNSAVERRPIDLSALSREVLADFGPAAVDVGIDLSLEQELKEPIIVTGVEAAIRSALVNLIGNALTHAEGATRVLARLNTGCIEIHDNGAGLANGRGSQFGGSGRKGNSSRNGAGLGLSIVDEIMVFHGGSMRIDSNPEKGTTTCLIFPEAHVP